MEHRLMRRHVVEGLAIRSVPRADLEGVEPAEHIEFGDQAVSLSPFSRAA